MPLTEYQELAAGSRGGSRLVSAAAGSGKTTVLVERLLRRVVQGADIDDFLVVTFTRAAAGELRARIGQELNELLSRDPRNPHLRRQPQLVVRAGIGTIDSLCGRFLRENTHLAGIAPDFRVVEPDRADVIRAGALDRLMESVYAGIDGDPAMKELVDSFGIGRNDQKLTELVLRLHAAVQSHPDPAEWLRKQRRQLSLDAGSDAGATVWGRYLLGRTAAQAAYWERRLSALLGALLSSGNKKNIKGYRATLETTLEGLRALVRASAMGWEAARAAAAVPFPRAGGSEAGDPVIEEIKAARKGCKTAADGWVMLFSQDSAELMEELAQTRGAVEALLRLTEALDKAYGEAKKRQGVVDFSDQEHMVLALLEDEGTGLAKSLSDRYAEVLVDEYQDVNACQDRLFTLLSDNGRKLFCVGDVKQSIYRFRLADPTIFLEKYSRWTDVAPDTAPGEPGRILLRENFRSRPEVIDAVNHVFRNIMSETLGELSYDDAAALRPGRAFPEGAGQAELTILSSPQGEDDERPDGDLFQARYVAGRIRSMVDGGVLVTDGDGMRRADWGDFVILLRSRRTASYYRSALAEQGIPAAAQQGGGFFQSLEVSALMAVLAVIDNPRQDVPLICALRSPLFGFSADELSMVRAADRDHDFYTALTRAAETTEKAAAFLRLTEELRRLSPDLTVEALLDRICDKTELLALLSAMPDGPARRENVQLLRDYARQFEQSGYRGVFPFLEWLRRLEERGEEPRTGTERTRAVQIVSIHHSKGLEYPIVFLCAAEKPFNLRDTWGDVLLHPEMGVGGRVIDAARGVAYPSLAWRAVSDRLRGESLSEEMRVLYVAMTRAKDRLYVTGRVKDAAGYREKMAAGLTAPLEPELLRRDACPLNWLTRAALLPGSPLRLRLETDGNVGTPVGKAPETPAEAPAGAAEDLSSRLKWAYPLSWAQELPSKVTATALRRQILTAEDAAALAPEDRPERAARRPDFGRADAALTGAERGAAVHTVLEFMDFRKGGSEAEIREEIGRLLSRGHLTPAQAAAADPGQILSFFRSDVGRRAAGAEKLWRELRFSMLIGAETFYPVPPGEELLLQGVVDCCFREGDGLVVVDYKTDFVTEETLPGKVRDYTPQLRAYAVALERLLGLPVREGYLFFLRPGRPVKVDL